MHVLAAPDHDLGSLFNAKYFETGLGLPYERNDHWLNFFGAIADEIIRSLKPRTAFDAGCAMGMLVESLWDRGVEARGVDLSAFAISQVRRDIQPYCREGSLVEPIEGRYDLVICIEVLEHLLPDQTEAAVANLAAAGDAILFSSSPTDFAEPTHFNVRPIAAWLKSFAEVGFWPDCVFDGSFLAPHAMLLRRQTPLPEGVLTLFAEKIRLKCALVEREQRIGNLNGKIAELTAASLASKEFSKANENAVSAMGANLEHTLDELRWLRNEHNRVSREFALLQSINLQLSMDQRNLRDESRRISREQIALSDENARLSHDLDVARRDRQRSASELEKFRGQVAGLEAARAEVRLLEHRLDLQRTEIARLEAEIAHVERSAAWQFAKRYRAWIDRRRTSPVVRVYDNTAKWLIRKSRFPGHEEKAPPVVRGGSVEKLSQERAHDGASHIAVAAEKDAPQDISPARAPADATPVEPAAYTEASNILPLAGSVQHRAVLDPEPYERWFERNEPGPGLLNLQRRMSLNLRLQPLICVIVPIYDVPPSVLKQAVESVLDQTYHNWQLCITHSYPPDAEGRAYLTSIASQNARVRINLLEVNHGISGNSNLALELVEGEFVALLDHDDVLAPFALFEIAAAVNRHPNAGFFYSDKDCITEEGRERLRPLFKPKWSADTMLSANYLTHLCVMRTDVIRAVGGWRSETDGAQDWDLFLRVIDSGAEVVHVPGVLYHWRIISTSVASGGLDAKPYALAAQKLTIDQHLARRGFKAQANIDRSGLCRLRWEGARQHGVTVILLSSPGRFAAMENWALRIDTLTEWPSLEIVAPSRFQRESLGRIKFMTVPEEASTAVFLNGAVRESRGEFLIFLDEAVEVTDPDWLTELVGPLDQAEIGIVGASLLDSSNSKLVHAGLVFNADGTLDYIFSGQPQHVYGQFGSAMWYRNWSAVAGSCLAIRREVFEQAGGFHHCPEYPRHDVDLCLRVKNFGYRIFFNPFARFTQSGTSLLETWLSADGPKIGSVYFRQCFPSGDPCFHGRLESRSGNLLFADKNRSVTGAHDYDALSRAFVGGFDVGSDLIEASRSLIRTPREHALQRLVWILPEFDHGFYGGVHTILRFADYFRRAHRVESEFVFTGAAPERLMRQRVAAAFPDLAATCAITRLRSYGDWSSVGACDATISTLWTTAYAALHFKQTRHKFYFIQDYESLFYPAGSSYALVEATYRFGYSGICNTRSLKCLYEEFGGEAEFFDPCIDPDYFFETERPTDSSRPYTVFCYARPGHPRNCFELLASALRILKNRMDDEVHIFTAGAEWNPADYDLQGVVENLGLLDYASTGALYRTCDAGIVMMMTRHPSYLPLELMACGALVITNENRYTRWFLKDEQNCLLSETTSTAMANTIERGLRDAKLRKRITRRAAERIRTEYSNWDAQTEKIYRYIVSQI